MSDIKGTCTDVDGTAYVLIVRGSPTVGLVVCEEDGTPKFCVEGCCRK
jgi:hypothetical protein